MPAFKGGVYVDDQGYLRISAGKHRNRRVHDMIAEAMLGRPLEKWEDAHHKNNDKLDCAWENIEVIDHRAHGFVSSAQAQFMKRKEDAERKAWIEYGLLNEDEENEVSLNGTEQTDRGDMGMPSL